MWEPVELLTKDGHLEGILAAVTTMTTHRKKKSSHFTMSVFIFPAESK